MKFSYKAYYPCFLSLTSGKKGVYTGVSMVFLSLSTDNCVMAVQGQCCFICRTAACSICESSVIFLLATVAQFEDKII
jgi:hypothetical protein